MKFKLLITLLALLSTPSLFASFYRGSIWTYTDSQGEEHFVYCLGDVHKGFLSNCYQRQQLSRVFKRIDVTNSLAIVEDPATLWGKEWYKIPSENHSILNNITQFFHEHSIQPINIEFRNCNDLRNYWNNRASHFNFSEFASLLEKYVANVDRALLETYTYQNDSILRDFYTKSRNTTNQSLPSLKKILSIVKNPKYTSFTLLGPGSFEGAVVQSATAIIDLRALNTLIQHRKKKHIFICTGGAHIQNIEEVLPKLGYKEIQPERYLFTLRNYDLFSASFTALNLDRMFDEFFAQYPQALAPKKDDQTQSLGVAASLVAASLNAGGSFTESSAQPDQSTQPHEHYKQPHQANKANHFHSFRRNVATAPRIPFRKAAQPLPITRKLLPQPTFSQRFTSRPFKFAALGLAGLSALSAYAWFGR